LTLEASYRYLTHPLFTHPLPCQAAAKEGKRAAELAAALAPHLKKSLLYEVESSGLK